jgi:pullulanase
MQSPRPTSARTIFAPILRWLLCMTLIFAAFGQSAHAATPIPANHIRIHYFRPDANYTGWTVYAFGNTTEDQNNFNGGPVQISGTDSFGVYFDVGITSPATDVGIIIHNGGNKDPGPDEHVNPSTQGNEYWQVSGVVGLSTTQPSTTSHKNPAIPPNVARVHFFRPDGNYANWTVYAFNDTTADTGNYGGGPVQQTGSDAYGAYYDVPLKPNPNDIGFIVHNIQTGAKNTPADLHLNVALYNEVWIISGDPTVYLVQPTEAQLLGANFLKLQAFWIDRNTIAIQQAYLVSGGVYKLFSDPTAQLKLTATGVTGGTSLTLTPSGALSADQIARFPQLATGYTALQLPANLTAANYSSLLQGQLAVSVQHADGSLTYATGVQDAGVLDDLYAYAGKLGVVIRHANGDEDDADDDSQAKLKVKVWAPTAQSMVLQLFTGSADTTPAKTVTMQEKNGLWVAALDANWIGKYYLLDEKVYAPSTRSIVENIVTDPYSIDLALNGSKSRLTDMDADANQPAGWERDRSPALARINDLSIYELHVRDFSIGDSTVPSVHRGTYLAFTDTRSNGMQHLEQLADAGLKAVHLLPTFHFNSVNEDKSTWKTTGDLSGFAPDGQQQQAAVTAIQSADGYNWGYDPDHYLAPEGSYAVNPDQRVKEYRQMVMGLHRAGLRVIQDVVFNHTSGFGEASNSILDEVVPDYYNRLDNDGNLETGSCCADTATEHLMMGKLQQDAVVWNAKKYKIDGFRFDIMSFTFVKNLQQIRQALAKLTLEKDGVDGSKIYIYGEGFNFGETANSALGLNASQLNLYGTGFGTFNDRIRDGVRGGGPFDDARIQGFATGLFTDPSSFTVAHTSATDQKATLLHRSDWIRVGLTGNLRDYQFIDATGAANTGGKLDYQGQPTGYTASPVEAVNYVSVHDNQDLFDTVQVKASESDTAATRARRQVLAMSVVALGQGIPFFMAGDDLLRSKDMDQNSYDSGDWFNKIDWTGQGNNWGIGLPIASQNSGQWFYEQPLLANGALKPTPAEIQSTMSAFQDFLRIRQSSDLFRMGTYQEVQQNLLFLNTGATQVPGLIVMQLGPQTGTREAQRIVVVFNATSTTQQYVAPSLAGTQLHLHPIQRSSSDQTVRMSDFDKKTGTLTVPALTTAVFISKE